MKNDKVFIIAEAGVNHNGDLRLAYQLIDVAVAAGADAIKFQTFKAENVISKEAPKAKYQRQTPKETESQLEMVKKLELPFEAFIELQKYSKQKGIIFMSTPFDDESVDFLAGLEMPFFKVPSGELTNLLFLEKIAKKRKPMIVSTGMSDLEEVRTAVDVIQQSGNKDIVLLHCVSNYPAEPKDVNLRAMQTMRETFGYPVGFSDHTLGIFIPLAAVAMGACIIEKHFTLSHHLAGPDHQASLEPQELKEMVEGIRMIELAMGHGKKEPAENEKDTRSVARKSLIAACDIPVGAILTREMIAIKRPGTGLPPAQLESVLGRKVIEVIKADTLIHLNMLVPNVS